MRVGVTEQAVRLVAVALACVTGACGGATAVGSSHAAEGSGGTSSGGATSPETGGSSPGGTTSAGGTNSTGGTTSAGGMSSGGLGGRAGAGGTAVTGGAPGTGGSGGATSDAGACKDCLTTYDFHWGPNGGLVMYSDTSRLGPCRSYTHERVPSGAQTPSLTCTDTLPGCPDRTLSNILALIDDSAVQNAMLNRSLFGYDSRPVDGSVFRFAIGTSYADVGDPCNGRASCTDPPPVITKLVALLQELDTSELAKAPCSSVFGPMP